MRTIFYHFTLVASLIYTFLFRMPFLILKKGKEKNIFSQKTAKFWGKILIWAASSRAKIIYENNSIDEIESISKNNEPVILISNHQSNLDIPTLLAYLPLNFSFIAKKEMKNWPIIGLWMKALNCIFLDRKNFRQGMKDMKKAIKNIENGYSYVIFPEGSRSPNGNIQDFKKGSFKLAVDTKVKIIPITLIGTYNIQKKGSLKINKNKNIKIIIDKPINYKTISPLEQKNIHIIVRDIIKNNFEKYKDFEGDFL